MDEEAAKAIQEAMDIFQDNKTQEPSPAAPIDTLPVQEAELSIITEQGTHPCKRQKRSWLALAGLMAGIISMTVTLILVIAPLFTPTASVKIIPAEATVTVNGTLQVMGRVLPTITMSQARTVPATGTGHQDAQAAQGSVTFYNGYTQTQVIPAGTLLQTAGGVQIVISKNAYVPPSNPPMQGQATVPAHALETGIAGNVKAYSIYGACCRAYILVENKAAFTGGQDDRAFRAVTQSDLGNVTNALKTSLMQGMEATFQAQLYPGEAIVPPLCAIQTTSDHQAGEEATQVGVTTSAACSTQAYQTQEAQAQAAKSITVAATHQLGSGYAITGDPRITITGANASKAVVSLYVRAQATMVYQFGQGQLQAIRNRIAGMTRVQATAWLARQKGVKAVSIEAGGTGATLPRDTSSIRCTVLYAT